MLARRPVECRAEGHGRDAALQRQDGPGSGGGSQDGEQTGERSGRPARPSRRAGPGPHHHLTPRPRCPELSRRPKLCGRSRQVPRPGGRTHIGALPDAKHLPCDRMGRMGRSQSPDALEYVYKEQGDRSSQSVPLLQQHAGARPYRRGDCDTHTVPFVHIWAVSPEVSYEHTGCSGRRVRLRHWCPPPGWRSEHSLTCLP